MADFFARLAERAIGQAAALRPVIVPSFAPASVAADLPQDSAVASAPAFGETPEQPTLLQGIPTTLPPERLVTTGPTSRVEDSFPMGDLPAKAETQGQPEAAKAEGASHVATHAASLDHDLEPIASEVPARDRPRPSPLEREQQDTSQAGRRRPFNLGQQPEVSSELEQRPDVPEPLTEQRRPRPPASTPRQREPTGVQDVRTAPADGYAEAEEEIGRAVPRVPHSPTRTLATTSRRQVEPASATASTRPEEPPRVRSPQGISMETEAEGVEEPTARRLISPKEPRAPARVQTLQEAPYSEEQATLSPAIPLTDGRAFDGPRSRSEAQPTIRVAIGRIEIRANIQTPPTAPTAAPRRRGPALPLADYLEQRREGKR